jgi:hypothetical protein
MTVMSIEKDPEKLTLTLVAEFAATPTRAWSVWTSSCSRSRQYSWALASRCSAASNGPISASTALQ